MAYEYRFENYNPTLESTRSAQIEEVNDMYEVHFYENSSYIGTIEYPEKSFSYVMDAGKNWVDWIMDIDTVERYKR